MVFLSQIMLLETALFGVALLIHANYSEAVVYCVKGSPAISWPSSAVPDIQKLSFLDANVRLSIFPARPTGVAVSLESIPYHMAILRIDQPGKFTTDNHLDCGSRAAGMSNTDTDTLAGVFSSPESLFDNLPLEIDVTLVFSGGADQSDSGSLVFAYEQIVLENWMLDAKNIAARREEDSFIVSGTGSSVTLDFGEQTTSPGEPIPPPIQPTDETPERPSWMAFWLRLFGLL